MPSQRTDEAWIGRLVGRLRSLVPEGREPDRATLAKLRRGLGKPVGKGGERDIWLFRSLEGAAPEHEEAARADRVSVRHSPALRQGQIRHCISPLVRSA